MVATVKTVTCTPWCHRQYGAGILTVPLSCPQPSSIVHSLEEWSWFKMSMSSDSEAAEETRKGRGWEKEGEVLR